MIKYHNKSNLRKKRFILANSSTEIRIHMTGKEWWQKQEAERSQFIHTQQTERETGESGIRL